MARNFLFTFLFFLIIFPLTLYSQNPGIIDGKVQDENNNPLPGVFVKIDKGNQTCITNDSGYFHLKVTAETILTLTFTLLSYEPHYIQVYLKKGEQKHLNPKLTTTVKNIGEVSITNNRERASGISRINTKDFNHLPNPSGNFESLIKSMPGVSSSNELSSQYSVRGGNYDENLVYVNDVEIYRPFLIRSGQQEGLSFINPEMVSAVKFSAGGFEARYGDKMASVLDVIYRKPSDFQNHVSISLLGASATMEGQSKNKKISWIAGLRYKTSQYLLSTLETKGDYKPSFYDIQTSLTYQPIPQLEINFLGNYAQNNYKFVPQTRSSNFGTYNQMYNLTIYFDGKEADKYITATGALSVSYKPSKALSLKFVSSVYAAAEQEAFDIEGFYYINALDNNQGPIQSRDSSINIGVGSMLNHARNSLYSNTCSFSHIGTYSTGNQQLRWSIEYKKEKIDDKVNEYTFIDSAEYMTPYHPTSIVPNDYVFSNHQLSTNRFQGFIQDAFQWEGNRYTWYVTGGMRYNYWSNTRELLVSPRLRIAIKPKWNRDIMFFVAGGIYSQPPSYREMRDVHGKLNPDIKAQRSMHLVVGSDYNLVLWDRPFKFTSEIYYKNLWQLIPYTLDNLQIKSTALNNAQGYATGIDLKLNGEFVPGAESWFSLSIMQSKEKRDETYTDNTGHSVQPGYYSRPSDQLINLNIFFQDHLPSNPSFQAYLNMSYGSGLQSTPPNSVRYDQTFPMEPYRRVDLGLSKILKNDAINNQLQSLRHVKEFVISLEIFNLMDFSNKASYLWIRTVQNQENIPAEFAVPNYLTSRRINLKIAVKF